MPTKRLPAQMSAQPPASSMLADCDAHVFIIAAIQVEVASEAAGAPDRKNQIFGHLGTPGQHKAGVKIPSATVALMKLPWR